MAHFLQRLLWLKDSKYYEKNADLNENIAFLFQLIQSFFITVNKTVHASDVHLLSFTHTFVLEEMKRAH